MDGLGNLISAGRDAIDLSEVRSPMESMTKTHKYWATAVCPLLPNFPPNLLHLSDEHAGEYRRCRLRPGAMLTVVARSKQESTGEYARYDGYLVLQERETDYDKIFIFPVSVSNTPIIPYEQIN